MKEEIEALAEKWVDENYAHQSDVDPYKCFIAGYNSANEWVKCSERLPEDNLLSYCVINVLCLLDNEQQSIYSFIKEPNEKGNFYFNYGNIFNNETERVFAWMPLPTPPTT